MPNGFMLIRKMGIFISFLFIEKSLQMIVTTLQAVSGAGFPGVSSFDIIDNVVPFISGEEEKSELEPQKIFG